ncbi:MAG: hypothetical protein KF901_24865 [Myxococcales bacterium]|nr:hypothetical protein [Myxococcales bacterium]
MSRSLALLVALLGPALAGGAHAQDEAGEGRELFRAGVEALREGRHEDAARAFRRSYDAEPRAATLCNLALTYEEWGDHVEHAASTYERCAAEDDTGRFVDHARERAHALRAEQRAAGEPAPPAPVVPMHNPFADETPATTTHVVITSGPEESSPGHGLLFAGGVTAAVGGVALIVGAVFAGRASDAAATLDARHPGDGPVTLPAGSPDAALLAEAERDRGRAIGFYVGGATIVTLGVALAIVDLLRPRARRVGVAVAPVEGGAFATLRARFDAPRDADAFDELPSPRAF